MNRKFAVVAGSGFQDITKDTESCEVDTEFGRPSSPIHKLVYGSREVCFLARHGDDLLIPPHRINYRANMAALKRLGVESIVALNTVGVLGGDLGPGQLAVPTQLIDYTYGRDHSIHGDGSDTLEHVDFTEPFTATLRASLLATADAANVSCHDGGVYAVTQGPRLETAAEVTRLRRDGADYVGMTAMPEASLARELEMDYACVSLIVNYAAGLGDQPIHDDIEASTLTARTQTLKLLRHFFRVED